LSDAAKQRGNLEKLAFTSLTRKKLLEAGRELAPNKKARDALFQIGVIRGHRNVVYWNHATILESLRASKFVESEPKFDKLVDVYENQERDTIISREKTRNS
jgi:hypothetical protein